MPRSNSSLRGLKDQQRDALKERIVAAAQVIVHADGLAELTMRKLALALECSPMTLYTFFRDKHELQAVLATHIFDALACDLDDDTSDDAVLNLRDGCTRYVSFGIANPAEYRILFMTPTGMPPSGQISRDQLLASNRAFGIKVRRVQACIDAGAFKGDAFEIATIVWTTLHGIVSALITMPAFPFGNDDAFAQRTIDAVIRGLLVAA